MFTITKAVRVICLAGVAGSIAMLPPRTAGSKQLDPSVLSPIGKIPSVTVASESRLRPPPGYVMKQSRCTHYVEGEGNVENNSRIVNIAADGTVPIMRADPVVENRDNFARVAVATLPEPLRGGKGIDRQTGKNVSFVKLGQGVVTHGHDGTDVHWVVSSEQLGEPVRDKDDRLTYSDHCFRNPKTAGQDTAGWLAPGIELGISCVVEDMKMEWNAYSAYGWSPLVNLADMNVRMANDPAVHPHPDGARYVGFDGRAHVYTGMGAALNDLNGTERDAFGYYMFGERYCHMIVANGYEVPGAKRPATRSFPPPVTVNVATYIVWRPVDPNINIANSLE
jgi:hypothetical protein